MSLLDALERDFAMVMQTALADLDAMQEQAQRMLADSPPYDGNDRRGK